MVQNTFPKNPKCEIRAFESSVHSNIQNHLCALCGSLCTSCSKKEPQNQIRNFKSEHSSGHAHSNIQNHLCALRGSLCTSCSKKEPQNQIRNFKSEYSDFLIRRNI